jgi:hypothetical protein
MKTSFKHYLEESRANEYSYRDRLQEEIKEQAASGSGMFNNQYRLLSNGFKDFIEEARSLWNNGALQLDEGDIEILESDLCKYAEFEGEMVPLDCPIHNSEYIDEAEYKGDDVDLNSPKRGGPKKYYVYVKNEKGNVVKVNFGDSGNLKSKINDPEARKNFASRHKCSEKKDKTSAGYWSCNLPRYASQLGLSGGGNYYW